MDANNEAKVQRLMSSISSSTQRISQNANQVSAMIQQFGTPRDSLDHREKTFEIVRSTGQIAKDTFKQIKELNNYSQIISRDKQLKIQQDRLTDAYTKSLKTLQDNEKKLAAQKPLSDNVAAKTTDIQLIDIDNNQASYVNNQAYEQQQRQMQIQEEDKRRAVEEQNLALRHLEKDITDVNSIFKDLAILVHDQGEVIDSIEKNIEQTQGNVKEANVQLVGAVKYQSKARRKKMCLVLIVIVLLAIIGIVIYFSIPKKK